MIYRKETRIMTKADKIRELFPELKLVSDKKIADQACALWVDFWESSQWNDVCDAPFNFEKNKLTLITHTQAVVKGAIALAEAMKRTQGTSINMDVLIISCILHDVSKLVEYSGFDEHGVPIKSEVGKAYQHAFLGAAKAVEIGMPTAISSIILLHTDQSNRNSDTVECLLLKCADTASAKSI